MDDAIICSDVHLGSNVCQAKLFWEFLKHLQNGDLKAKRLIINGDLFENTDIRLKKSHWRILSLLRKLSNNIEVVWVQGNHDGEASEFIAHLIGIQLCNEYRFESGGKKVIVIHGDSFDDFITDHPILTAIADKIYYLIQKIDPSYSLAKFVKTQSKTFLRCAQKIKADALHYVAKECGHIIFCGHSHHVDTAVWLDYYEYWNSGCWTELPSSYLTIKEGKVKLHYVT